MPPQLMYTEQKMMSLCRKLNTRQHTVISLDSDSDSDVVID